MGDAPTFADLPAEVLVVSRGLPELLQAVAPAIGSMWWRAAVAGSPSPPLRAAWRRGAAPAPALTCHTPASCLLLLQVVAGYCKRASRLRARLVCTHWWAAAPPAPRLSACRQLAPQALPQPRSCAHPLATRRCRAFTCCTPKLRLTLALCQQHPARVAALLALLAPGSALHLTVHLAGRSLGPGLGQLLASLPAGLELSVEVDPQGLDVEGVRRAVAAFARALQLGCAGRALRLAVPQQDPEVLEQGRGWGMAPPPHQVLYSSTTRLATLQVGRGGACWAERCACGRCARTTAARPGSTRQGGRSGGLGDAPPPAPPAPRPPQAAAACGSLLLPHLPSLSGLLEFSCPLASPDHRQLQQLSSLTRLQASAGAGNGTTHAPLQCGGALSGGSPHTAGNCSAFA